jgi:hypothetical protein
MKVRLQRLIGMAVLGSALFSSGIPAWAGRVNRPEVQIGTNFAKGSMAGARYRTDSTQYIGCSFPNANSPFVSCAATDKAGKNLFCVGYDTRYKEVLKSISDFSLIEFSVAAGGTLCDSLTVRNLSDYLR